MRVEENHAGHRRAKAREKRGSYIDGSSIFALRYVVARLISRVPGREGGGGGGAEEGCRREESRGGDNVCGRKKGMTAWPGCNTLLLYLQIYKRYMKRRGREER